MNGQIVRAEPMKQQAVAVYGERSLTAADIRAQVNLIQDVMRSVMIEGTHYGKIPGTQSMSLYKPGAEKLMATFRLGSDVDVDDLGENGEVHYRVKYKILSPDGRLLGVGVGECSSQEDKYAWRRPVCDKEFDIAPENQRRIKFAKGDRGTFYENKQVRTNPFDVRNTVLKMAKKRAMVDAVLTVTAASDIFTQDIEDLPDELREQIAEGVRTRATPAAKAAQQATPDDSPERDEAIAECRAAAAKGTEHFRQWWKDSFPKSKRALVSDKVAYFQAIAQSADDMTIDAEDE
jgi:hypothetical protein